ncbi:hypothetical protein FRX31_005816 [Thalictrum thalictroides]|uniref:OTU domain-containing protein n=1 Tax=Thalictrum thalictroides TaxID=46969 RepID=A0A7J6X6B0_THATH|nr:hypothetical protein FRX31_005816 [Thalictrum thalictroides]
MEVQETTQSEIESISNSPLEVQDLNMKKNNANVENNVEYPDLSTRFTTDRVFDTRSDLIQWAQKVGQTCGTVVVVSKSENATSYETHSLRRTHGLPCAHELNIIGLQGNKIHLEEINDFWKKLSITVFYVDLSDLEARPEFLALIDRYKNLTTDQQVFMLKQMLELGNPQCSGLLQPLVKAKTKGRPFGWRKELPKVDNSTKRDPSAFEPEIHEFNSSQSAKPTTPAKKKLKVTKSTTPRNKKMNVLKTPQSLGKVSILKFPDFFRPFIIDANNVDGDGNCGFRAVAACMEMDNENGWLMVRSDLIGELLYFREEYNKVFGGKEQVDTLLDILDTYDSPCPPKNWFLLPYMGYLVASTYHHVLVSISPEA